MKLFYVLVKMVSFFNKRMLDLNKIYKKNYLLIYNVLINIIIAYLT